MINLLRKIVHDVAYWKGFSFFNSRLAPCRKITERLSIPEKTSFLQKIEIHFHLFICDVCRAFFMQTEWMKNMVKKLFQESESTGKISELSKKIIEKHSKK